MKGYVIGEADCPCCKTRLELLQIDDFTNSLRIKNHSKKG